MKFLKNDTVLNNNGEIVHFGLKDFIKKICTEDNCFICGASRNSKKFNDEHIIPQWVLKRFDLYGKYITLPNKVNFRYDKYTIPCCYDCNTMLGEKFESRICEAFSKDYNHLSEFCNTDYPLLYIWLALIFLKTHLKDKQFKEDFRKEEKISKIYDWSTLHHIHCLVRAICFGFPVNTKALGSIVIVPTTQSSGFETFDYSDLYICNTILIKLGGIGIIAVLNDSCICMDYQKNILSKIEEELNPLQLRELFVRFAHCNISIKNRPRYYSTFDLKSKKIVLNVKLPKTIKMYRYNRKLYGKILFNIIQPLLANYENEDKEFELENLKLGKLSYLLDEKGKFNKKSIIIKEKSGDDG